MSKRVKSDKQWWLKLLPYAAVTAGVFGLVFVGSQDKSVASSSNLDMKSIYSNNYQVSADQISEFYMVSNLANAMNLSTSEAIQQNYTTVSIMQDVGQVGAENLEKPDIVNTEGLSRGIESYTVKEGDTMEGIASKYGLTTDQIRWSNNLKTTAVSAGQTLNLPSSGIIYTVKAGDTVESLATKYKSTTEQIIAYNDLETVGGTLTAGAQIILPSGELPETERPEYVAPTTRYSYSSGSSSYTRTLSWTSSGSNPMPYGWCTYYAWGRRAQMGGAFTLPSGLGNASTWDNALSGWFRIDRTPEAGAVFQTDYGYYGHVGIVDSVNSDGTITISDMNGIAGWGRVGTKTIDSSEWGKYKYIHERL